MTTQIPLLDRAAGRLEDVRLGGESSLDMIDIIAGQLVEDGKTPSLDDIRVITRECVRAVAEIILSEPPSEEMAGVDVSPLPLLRLGSGNNDRVQEWRRHIYAAMSAARLRELGIGESTDPARRGSTGSDKGER